MRHFDEDLKNLRNLYELELREVIFDDFARSLSGIKEMSNLRKLTISSMTLFTIYKLIDYLGVLQNFKMPTVEYIQYCLENFDIFEKPNN